MKNKKNIYILLPAVLLIWGTVAYEFLSFSGNDDFIGGGQSKFEVKPFRMKQRDTFSIRVDYRDPFLGKAYLPEKQRPAKTHKQKKQVEPAIPVAWPDVLYKGIVSDLKGKTNIYVLIINRKTFLIKKGGTENEVTLLEGNRQTVTLKYKGEQKTLSLQK